MDAPEIYSARAYTCEHSDVAGLPMYAARMLVELPPGSGVASQNRVFHLAEHCLRMCYSLTGRAIEVDEVEKVYPRGYPQDWHYEDEFGRARVMQELREEQHPQTRRIS
jgi:hypothetical protein